MQEYKYLTPEPNALMNVQSLVFAWCEAVAAPNAAAEPCAAAREEQLRGRECRKA